MRIIISVLFVLISFAGVSQESHLTLQASHVEGATKAVLDNQRNVLITFGYKDNALKFWNKNSGQLYKTIELPGYGSNLVVNEREGKSYILVGNTIYVYDNSTFSEIANYPLGRIYSLYYHNPSPTEGYLLLYAEDQNGKKAMYALNESTGEFLGSNLPEYPGEGDPTRFQFTSDSSHVWIETNYAESFLLDVSTGAYYEVKYDAMNQTVGKDYPLAMFDNGEILFLTYTTDNKTELSRQNVITGAKKWSHKEARANLQDSKAWAGYQVTIENDQTSFWITAGESEIFQFSAPGGFLMGKIYQKGFKSALTSDGDYIYVQNGLDKPYSKFEPYETRPVVKFGASIFESMSTTAYFDDSQFEIITGDFDGTTYSVLSNANTTHLTKYNPNYKYDGSQGSLVADPATKDVYALPRNGEKIKVFQRGQANSFVDKIENTEEVSNFDFDSDRKIMATMGGAALRVLDMNAQKELYLKIIPSSGPLGNDGISLSPKGSQFVYITYNKAGVEFVERRVECIDYQTKEVLWTKMGRYSAVRFIEDGAKVFALQTETNLVEILDSKTGVAIKSFKLQNNGFDTTTLLTPNEKYLYVSGVNSAPTIYNAKNGARVKTLPFEDNDYFNPSFLGNNLIMKTSNGSIKLFDINTGKEVVRLYVFLDNEWIAHTPDGHFDGSQNAWKRVAFAKGNTFIPLESVFNKFYTPRLLHKIYRGQGLDRDIEIDDLNPAPTALIHYSEGSRNLTVEDDDSAIVTEAENAEITINASAPNDRIIEIRLFHNGKLIANTTRNLTVEDDDMSSGDSKVYKVKLLEGENLFTAVALNSQNTESMPTYLRVAYKPAKQKIIKPQGIQTYIFVVGIDSYKNPKYNLNYAVADASSFQETIVSGIESITSKSHLFLIKNDQAIRANILNKFQEIAGKANPQDVFIFYYAGHGVVAQEGTKDFYLVPHDVTQLYGNDGALKQKGISASELKKIATTISAQKQLYILDACQSAGALNTIATRGASEEKAIAQLARSTGTHWLTASGSEQYATEFDELGHGVFTYALLEALSGKADSGDKRVTVNELKAYIESRVPEISEKYKGSPQYPSSFGFGQDFPVSIAK